MTTANKVRTRCAYKHVYLANDNQYDMWKVHNNNETQLLQGFLNKIVFIYAEWSFREKQMTTKSVDKLGQSHPFLRFSLLKLSTY